MTCVLLLAVRLNAHLHTASSSQFTAASSSIYRVSACFKCGYKLTKQCNINEYYVVVPAPVGDDCILQRYNHGMSFEIGYKLMMLHKYWIKYLAASHVLNVNMFVFRLCTASINYLKCAHEPILLIQMRFACC